MFVKLLKYFIPESLLPLNYLTNRTIRKAHGKVQCGPFSSMKYIEKAYCSSICPKLTVLTKKRFKIQ